MGPTKCEKQWESNKERITKEEQENKKSKGTQKIKIIKWKK